MNDSRSSLSWPRPDAVARSLMPSPERSQRRCFMPVTPSPRSVNNISLWIYNYKVMVKDSKRRAFWSLKEDILKINILKTNTLYPSRKIRHIRAIQRIRACTHQRPHKDKAQYVVSRGLNTPYSICGTNIIFWKLSSVVPTSRNPQYAVSNTWIRCIEPTFRPYK
ncbi:hypothetical protein Tco_0602525 [Tanacetum coccineum]